ncbi:MAG: 50S ribosomal protein L13 [Candidatus Peribacteraceae bacterium]|jgi:large subunit ribosomal protein L13
MKTSTIPPAAPEWHIVDAEGQSPGRLSADIATVLRGKHRPSFSPHQMCGDHVIVINAEKIKLQSTQLYRKVYYKHTGYLGHLKTTTLGKMMEKNPCSVLERAVKGMLPKNRLRIEMLKRLHVVPGAEHPHEAQKPTPLSFT